MRHFVFQLLMATLTVAVWETSHALDCEYAISLYEKAQEDCRAGVQHEGVRVQPCEYAEQLKKNYFICSEAIEEEEDDEFWFDAAQWRGPWDCPFAWGGYLWTKQHPTACDDIHRFGVDSCEEIKDKFVDDSKLYRSNEVYRMAMNHRSQLMMWCAHHSSICTQNLEEKQESGQLRNQLFRNFAIMFDYRFEGQTHSNKRNFWNFEDPKKHGWRASCGYCPQFIEQTRRIPYLVFGLCDGVNPLELRER